MKPTRLVIVAFVLLIALAVVGCSGSGSSGTAGTGGTTTPGTAADGATVIEKSFAFDPAALEVKVGDTVTFTNEDSTQHIVSIDGRELAAQDPGASVTWTADKAGTFPYSCTIHPSMTGEIVVK